MPNVSVGLGSINNTKGGYVATAKTLHTAKHNLFTYLNHGQQTGGITLP